MMCALTVAFTQIMKKNEQMYALLAIAVSLSPQRIDENVHSVLKEKYADKMARMQRGYVHALTLTRSHDRFLCDASSSLVLACSAGTCTLTHALFLFLFAIVFFRLSINAVWPHAARLHLALRFSLFVFLIHSFEPEFK